MGYFYFLFPVLTDKTKDYLCIFATHLSAESLRVGVGDVDIEMAFTNVRFSCFKTSQLLSLRKTTRRSVLLICFYPNGHVSPARGGRRVRCTYQRGLSALLVLEGWALRRPETRNG